jgi:hypothetical protein
VADYGSHFNIPLSKQTYNSLIPALKDIVGRMKTKNGIDYLMHFTRMLFFTKETQMPLAVKNAFTGRNTFI